MNILGITQRYFPVIGGSEILAKNFLDYMAKKHNITVYTTNANKIDSFWNAGLEKITDSEKMSYDVVRCDFLTPEEIKYEKNLEKLEFITNFPGPFSPQMWRDLVTTKIHYDMIFSTAFPYDHIFPAFIAAKKWKIPLVIMPLIHQEFLELYLNGIKLSIINYSEAIFVISNSEKEILIRNGINENKIKIIRPFIPEPFNNILDVEKFRKNYKIPLNKKIILFIGSKSYVKGVMHLIEAMKLIWKKRDDYILLLIGPSTKEFEIYFSKLPKKLQGQIVDLGIINEETKNDALSSSEMLVLPSQSESFGLVFIEAWNYSKPVIGCKLLPVSGIIDENKNGMLVEFGNIQELQKKILFLIENPDVGKKYGIDGKKKSVAYQSQENLKLFEKECYEVVEKFKKSTL